MRSRGIGLVVAGTIVLVLAASFARRAALGPSPLDRCDSRRFEPGVWSDTIAAHSPRAPRGCMVDDLLRRYELPGMTRATVIQLLGEPERTTYFREYDLVYYLGPERSSLGIDSEWLLLRLDRSGRVSEHRIATD